MPRGTKKPAAKAKAGSPARKAAGASGLRSAKPRKGSSTSVKMKSVGGTRAEARSARDTEGGGAEKGRRGAGSGRRGEGAGTTSKGKRKRQTRISLAVEFTVPVCLMIGLVIVVWGLVIRTRMQEIHLNEIKKNGASHVKALADLGRRILKDREDFGRSWPVNGGWVSAERWSQLTEGASNDDLPDDVARKALYKAAVLRGLTFYANPNQANEVLLAYILRTDDSFVACTHEHEGSVRIQGDDWIPSVRPEVTIGKNLVPLENIVVVPAVVQRGEGMLKAFRFDAPIRNNNGLLVGKAILALRGGVIESEQSALTMLMFGIGLVAMVLAAVVCVVIATTVTRPARMLIQDMEIVSRGNLEHKTRAHSQDEIGQIAVEFNEMTRKLLAAREMEREAERFENELDMARQIQARLLPKAVPTVGGFDMHAHYKAAREVGGDYYDFYPIGTKVHLGIIVADVSGKSVPGAIQMATTRTVLRFIAAGNTSAQSTLSKTNQIVAQDIKRGMFVTAFYVVLDAKTKSLLCASAGHNPMVVVRGSGELELVNPSGIALGFDKGPIFQRTIKEQLLSLGSGDRVVLYTDGVVEAMNSRNEEYGNERFFEFCKVNRERSSEEFVRLLLGDLDSHRGKAEQHDDITIVTFRVL